MTTTEPVLRVAAKAVIRKRGRVLIIREASTDRDNTKVGQWGLPGGRLKPGEEFRSGLAREVKEETSLDIKAIAPVHVDEWSPVIRGTPHQIIAVFMLCGAVTTEVELSDEHDAYAWIRPAQRRNYLIMAPEDAVLDIVARQNRWRWLTAPSRWLFRRGTSSS